MRRSAYRPHITRHGQAYVDVPVTLKPMPIVSAVRTALGGLPLGPIATGEFDRQPLRWFNPIRSSDK